MRQFETARLLMRPIRVEDRSLYLECYTDPSLMQHIGAALGHETALRSFTAALKMNSGLPLHRRTWVMQEKQSRTDIGLLALVCERAAADPDKADIGAIILAKFHNQGFAAEAIRALVDVTFANTTLATLSTHHDAGNSAADGLMQKLGFHRGDRPANHPACDWLLRRSDWQTRQSRSEK